jgi:drug/metabolite transporter (DMT)-like permease
MSVSPFAIALLIGCSIAFSLSDLFRKVLASWVTPLPLLFALSAGMVPVFAGWYWLEGAAAPEASYWIPGIGSTLLNVASNLALLEAVRRSPLSVTIPLLSLTPVFTSILAIPVLGEMPGPRQWVGIATVVIGAFWINLDLGELSFRNAWRTISSEPGSRLAVVVALLWSLAMPLDKIAVLSSSPAFHGLILSSGVGVAVLLLAWLRSSLGRFRELLIRPGLVLTGLGVSILAIAFQLVAIAIVWVGLVETMKRGIGSVLSQLWGRLVFNEPLEPQRLLGVLAMAVGVALILL